MAASTPTKVEFYFDVVSPYTWFCFEVLCRYKPYWNMDLVLRPFFLGGVMKATGNKPPMTVASKGMYMQKDLLRNADYFGINIKLIDDPYNVLVQKGSLKAMRFLTSINLHCPVYLENVSRELWQRIWSIGEDITEEDSFKLAAKNAQMNEIDIENCLKRMDEPETREALKKTTEEAVDYGAFGAPTIVVHAKEGPELFFGSDRFPLIAQLLKEVWKGPFPEQKNSKL
ncbi:glutathione S-transferase kappa 1-like [Daphnia pulicaria]|uniref:glutathione S-transferase kappa 1-like n=1 Tax=Daphnia pulicaria TaxID=35523 RepID=UPI001EEA9188|nr:glutathione S-transferase kappa 1-like [Daphnia pulicaria]